MQWVRTTFVKWRVIHQNENNWHHNVHSALSLAGIGIPYLGIGTAGFFSKDRIIEGAFEYGEKNRGSDPLCVCRNSSPPDFNIYLQAVVHGLHRKASFG